MKSLIKYAILAIILNGLGILGCGGGSSEDSLTYYPDTYVMPVGCTQYNVKGDLNSTALEAIDEWNTALGGSVVLFVEEDKVENIETIEITELDPKLDGYTYTEVYQKGANITCTCLTQIAPKAQNDIKVYVHELGHCLGLGHTNDTNSVMYPVPNGSTGDIRDEAIQLIIEHLVVDND